MEKKEEVLICNAEAEKNPNSPSSNFFHIFETLDRTAQGHLHSREVQAYPSVCASVPSTPSLQILFRKGSHNQSSVSNLWLSLSLPIFIAV
jgi:hypothetical protein